eukprot:CAMPEP_0204274284 /NCGR_PEP_ID=MMETSP0468-20130131/25104_1 /ASSEMBLY_ACC=CAM_ASM_000383 /TAXON_ID=2969 /ORGANISM="Oxyrrhis marina" /LENGTH=71 /DNA_ID=CAMNT_0051250479 /DNA_START=67 /DNA_END=282 /DNA_ORIENTATION=+
MRSGFVGVSAVSAMDKEEGCSVGDQSLCFVCIRDVNDACWEPLCKKERRVISEGCAPGRLRNTTTCIFEYG